MPAPGGVYEGKLHVGAPPPERQLSGPPAKGAPPQESKRWVLGARRLWVPLSTRHGAQTATVR